MASRLSERGSQAKHTAATATSGSAATIGWKLPTSRSPISHRTARNVSAKSAKYWTKRISAEKNALSVTPASSRTSVESPRRRIARERVDDGDGAERAGEAGDGHADTPAIDERRVGHDGEHRAERRAGRDAEREGRREGVAQQRLQHDAGAGERRADERARRACAAAAPRRRSARRRCRPREWPGRRRAARLIGVEPTSGASTHAARARPPKASVASATRRRMLTAQDSQAAGRTRDSRAELHRAPLTAR